MKNLKIKRRCVTLVEMMIVMFLIAMITGVIAYNYSGGLDEGKAFKTREGMSKISNIIEMYLTRNPEDRANLRTQWPEIVKSSSLVKKGNDLIHDGWGGNYIVDVDENGDIKITSEKYDDYQRKKGKNSLFTGTAS